MKTFFASVPETGRSVSSAGVAGFSGSRRADSVRALLGSVRQARVAVYDSAAAAPRVIDIQRDDVHEFIEELASRVYMYASDLGGSVPYTVVREIVENLIHADFHEVVVSVLDGGNEIRFADQGPGIPDKVRAVRPGFTTASAEMKRFIRGVGSGLPIVHEYLALGGGALDIDDNLGHGTVITLRAGDPGRETPASSDSVAPASEGTPERGDGPLPPAAPRLTLRQNKVLSLVMEYGSAGPSLVSRELGVGLSTAYRDLAALEEAGLIVSDDSGKRVLTPMGNQYLSALFSWDRE